jgi:branched-chain amino acid transport system permease protein
MLFFELLVSGVANGAIYALIALSFNLLYRTSGALNFAVGHLVMLGAFIATVATPDVLGIGKHSLVGAVVTVAAMGLVGMLVGRVIYIPLRHRHVLWFIVATLGLSIGLEHLILVAWGPEPRALDALFSLERISMGPLLLSGPHAVVIGAVVLTLIVLSIVLRHTTFGVRWRAMAQDEEAARLVGVNTASAANWVFGVSTAMAGLAGVLLAPITLVTHDIGRGLILKGFIAVVIGGFGSLPGAVLGGVALGIGETMLAQLYSSEIKEIILYAGLMVALVVRPQGFFGEEVGQRA